jgi:hypothetical protein
MRVLFGGLAVLLGAVSISLAARYGYKGGDTVIDGVISAVVFGAIALCAFLFDAAAVRLWFMSHRIGSAPIGCIAAAALIVTFTNSLGAIAGRADVTQAERVRAKDDAAADRAELARITQERAAVRFQPATEETVTAPRDAVAAAERIRTAECGNGDPKQRGPNCRHRETEEQARREALTLALSGKAAADRAASLDHAAETLRARLAAAPPVQNPNPLGAALALLLGAGAAALTAWQQAIVAAVFELCLVGVMVIYELLGHGRVIADTEVTSRGVCLNVGTLAAESVRGPTLARPALERSRAPKAAKREPLTGSVPSFVHDRIYPADGERLEMKSLTAEYRSWCGQTGCAPIGLTELLDEIEKVCSKLGVEIEVGQDQRVYCVGVKLGDGSRAAAVH